MADFHQRAVLVLEAHAILRILPRCLNPVAATIRVMKRRNSVRTVRHRCDFQRLICHRRHRNFVADRILNLLNQHLPSFRRILRRGRTHQRERHHVVALVGNRDVLIPDFQRQRQTGLVRILLLVIFLLFLKKCSVPSPSVYTNFSSPLYSTLCSVWCSEVRQP